MSLDIVPDRTAVLYGDRSPAFLVSALELRRLVDSGMVEVALSGLGRVKYATLLVPARVARRVAEGERVVGGPGGYVDSVVRAQRNAERPRPEINRQPAGRLTWVQRPDGAGRGLTCAAPRTIFFPRRGEQ